MIECAKNTAHANVPLKRIMFRARDYRIKMCFSGLSYQLLQVKYRRKTYMIVGTIFKQ
jgi:hypothetical protein